MRGFYEIAAAKTPPEQPKQSRLVKTLLMLAVLAFWLPSAAVDLYLIWRGGGREGVTGFVFGLLYRQSLVFLALWFAGALVHGIAVGRRTPAEPRRKRRRVATQAKTPQGAAVTLSRHNRGL